jgi:hypothetical protein
VTATCITWNLNWASLVAEPRMIRDHPVRTSKSLRLTLLWGQGSCLRVSTDSRIDSLDDVFLNKSATCTLFEGAVPAHMHKFARLLLLWIIAIALPVQGVFAGSLQHCIGGEHQVALADGASSSHPHDQASDSDEHGGGHAMHSHAALHPHVHQTGSSDSHHTAGLKGSCSACAACCGTTAPPPAAIVLVPQLVDHAVPSFVSFAVVTFVTDGPERPPRITLA